MVSLTNFQFFHTSLGMEYYERPESNFGYAEQQPYYQDPYGRPISRGGGGY